MIFSACDFTVRNSDEGMDSTMRSSDLAVDSLFAYDSAYRKDSAKEDQMVIGDAISNRVKPKKEVKVKVDKKEKPNLDAIKARAKKKVTAEDIVAVAAESTTETKTEVEEQPQTWSKVWKTKPAFCGFFAI